MTSALAIDPESGEPVEILVDTSLDFGPDAGLDADLAVLLDLSFGDPSIPEPSSTPTESHASSQPDEAEDRPPAATDSYGNLLGRGGFARDGRGSALVITTDPTDLYKSGRNKGRPKLYPYAAASSIALGTSSEALSNWKQNRMLEAVAVDPAFARHVRATLHGVDLDSSDGKDLLKTLRAQADEIAETHAAARRGTFAHWLTEQSDNGESIMESLAEGEAVGISPATADRMVEGWRATIAEFGFVSLAVEAALVNDDLRAAGTTDRVLLLDQPLPFEVAGARHVLDAGSIVIGDLKTGRLRLDRDGLPTYWEKYTGQLAAYAGGCPYDSANHLRLPWTAIGVPDAPSQDYAVLIHADLEALADHEGVDARDAFSVFVVDLARGRDLAHASNGLRRAEKRVRGMKRDQVPGAFAIPATTVARPGMPLLTR